ncbi:MAG TPA: hypothetical protein PKK06_17120 [Phycisphaerae bacterium]|nr:hypothetical protein [Phycisphaerae bacterium]HNU46885.1 hypothetical protein [Phycisphaerae bacterium]
MSDGGIRLLLDEALDGPTNMARDEALLQAVEQREAPPTLRVYQWDPPTISLGYFQRFADYLALTEPLCRLPVVRRLTGGGAILHDLEVTYALALPLTHPLLAGGPNHLYELAHAAVIATLGRLPTVREDAGTRTSGPGVHGQAPAPGADGQATPHLSGVTDDSGPTRGPFFCFARRHEFDVLLGADKIAGSAQRRTRLAVLQHGSIILGNRFPQQPTAVPALAFDALVRDVRARLPQEFARATGCALEASDWTPAELHRAAELGAKYAGPEWTRRA